MIKTLNARTVTARTVACVKKASLETERHVKVLTDSRGGSRGGARGPAPPPLILGKKRRND